MYKNKFKIFRIIIFTCLIVIFGIIKTAFAQVNPPPIHLSKKEKDFLKSHPVIKLGIDGTWAPHIIVGKDGKLSGHTVDILNHINRSTGANIQLVIGKWAELTKQTKNLEIDGLALKAPVEEWNSFVNG